MSFFIKILTEFNLVMKGKSLTRKVKSKIRSSSFSLGVTVFLEEEKLTMTG